MGQSSGGTKYASGSIQGNGTSTLIISNIGFVPVLFTVVTNNTAYAWNAVLQIFYDPNNLWQVTQLASGGYYTCAYGDISQISGKLLVDVNDTNDGQITIATQSQISSPLFDASLEYFWYAIG